jgi:hypothetical protein
MLVALGGISKSRSTASITVSVGSSGTVVSPQASHQSAPAAADWDSQPVSTASVLS